MSLLIVEGDAAPALIAAVAGALGACLARQGWRVAPLSAPAAAPPLSERIGGTTNSRLACVLAEACHLGPEDRFVCHGGDIAKALEALNDFETVIALGLDAPNALRLTVTENVEGLRVALSADSLGVLSAVPAEDLFPADAPELSALPLQVPGRPRIGIVSLPHITNFPAYSVIRGSEWIAGILPGNFDVILLPESGNVPSDRQWLGEQGLHEWLVMQKLSGCRLVAFSGGLAPQARVEDPDAVQDYRQLSAIIGARIPAPLPSEEDYDRLAAWIAGHLEISRLEHALRHGSGLIVE